MGGPTPLGPTLIKIHELFLNSPPRVGHCSDPFVGIIASIRGKCEADLGSPATRIDLIRALTGA
jgi:hypothetical protein